MRSWLDYLKPIHAEQRIKIAEQGIKPIMPIRPPAPPLSPQQLPGGQPQSMLRPPSRTQQLPPGGLKPSVVAQVAGSKGGEDTLLGGIKNMFLPQQPKPTGIQ